jgi:crotonobetainyl-CoA:carnitine CoA-transferase CaiB-like acyl-CoA transferase
MLRNAVRMTGVSDTVRTPSPERGGHTDEVLASLGYSRAEIGQLRAQAAI